MTRPVETPVQPDEWIESFCERCTKSADLQDSNGRWLCADCAFDEAEPSSPPREKEKSS